MTVLRRTPYYTYVTCPCGRTARIRRITWRNTMREIACDVALWVAVVAGVWAVLIFATL